MFYLIWFLAVGFIAGLVGKYLHPGEEPGGLMATMVIGIIGSFIGGMINFLIAGGSFGPAGLILSIVGAVIFCFAYNKYNLSKYIPLEDEGKDSDESDEE